MPVVAKGKTIVEKATGKVVAHAASKEKAKIYVRIRNAKHAEKMAKEGKS
jgi:hypothetical protein